MSIDFKDSLIVSEAQIGDVVAAAIPLAQSIDEACNGDREEQVKGMMKLGAAIVLLSGKYAGWGALPWQMNLRSVNGFIEEVFESMTKHRAEWEAAQRAAADIIKQAFKQPANDGGSNV